MHSSSDLWTLSVFMNKRHCAFPQKAIANKQMMKLRVCASV